MREGCIGLSDADHALCNQGGATGAYRVTWTREEEEEDS